MLKYLLTFCLFLHCFAFCDIKDSEKDSSKLLPLADTEAASSTIVGGVNVLTGSYVSAEQDLAVNAAEPLALTRFYTPHVKYPSGFHHIWRHNFNSYGELSRWHDRTHQDRTGDKWIYKFVAPHGSTTFYNRFIKKSHKEERKANIPMDFGNFPRNYQGLTNVGSDCISGQTNLKNQKCTFDQSKEKLTVVSGSGHQYILEKQDRFDDPERYSFIKKEGDVWWNLRIKKELKPNGNLIEYKYNSKDQLEEVRSVNADGSLLFGFLKFKSADRDQLKNHPFLSIRGSDGREVKYQFSDKWADKSSERKQYYIASVDRPEAPKVEFDYTINKHETSYLLSRIRYPEGRTVGVEYITEGEEFLLDRVKQVTAPIGENGEAETLYQFSYHIPNPDNIYTRVTDPFQHLTIYWYNKEPRLKRIERFTGTQKHKLYSIEEYHWGEGKQEGNLLSKTLKDSQNQILCCRAYHYDDRENVIDEQVWGNLTGTKTTPIKLNKGYPIANGAECYRILREYSTNGFNLLLKETFPNGLQIRYSYKPNTNLLRSKFNKGSGHQIREFYSYDQNALLIKKIQDNGTGTEEDDLSKVTQRLITYTTPNLTEGAIGLPMEVVERYLDLNSGIEKLLQRTLLYYDSYGHLNKKELFDSQNKLQLTLEWTYDAQGNLIQEQNSAEQTIEYRYDANKNRIYTKGPNQVEIHQLFDKANRCIKIEEKHGDERFSQSYQYDLLGRTESAIDQFGQKTQLFYDYFGRLTKKEFPPIQDAAGNLTSPQESYTYDTLGHKTSYIDPNGYATHYTNNIRGQPTSITYPDGSQEKFAYTLEGHLAKKWEKNGTVVHYSYDAFGRKTKEEKYHNHTLLTQESWVYDAFHLISHTDANGNLTLYSYDNAGRKVSETHPAIADATTQYIYDSCNRLWKTIQANTLVSVTEYDALNRPIEERIEDLQGTILSRSQYKYDLSGNRTDTIHYQEANAPRCTLVKYDFRNQPTCITDPLGFKTHIDYCYNFINEYGATVFQKTATDPNGIQTIETFNTRGSLASVIKRDSFGQLLSKEAIFYDLNGNAACWQESVVEQGFEKRVIINKKVFGPLNRIETLIEAARTPEQKTTYYHYNKYSQLENLVKPDGTLLQSSYDPLGRVQEYLASDQTIHYRYTYDNNHNLIAIEDAIQETTTTRTYDALDRMLHETLGNGLSLDYTYDSLNRRTQIQLPDCSSIRYRYDASNLKEVMRIDSQGNLQYSHLYQNHDLFGEAATIQLAKEAGIEERAYDSLGRRIATTMSDWAEKVPNQGFDPVGNLLALNLYQQNCIKRQTYAYDSLNQLTQEEGSFHHSYAYDSLNNCLQKDGQQRSHNALNQILTDGDQQYQYSANGNLIKTQNFNYTYDALDRLIQVENDETKVCYLYDHFHRRIRKKFYQNGQLNQTLDYLYCEHDEIGAYQNGQPYELRILGEGLGAEIGSAVALELNNQLYIPIHNRRGDLCRLIKAVTKEIVQDCRYSAFGETLNPQLSPWGFSSKRLDPETGFIYFGRRYYSPSVGRWLTPDPIGFRDGPNLYAYVHNSPLTHFDLYGLLAAEFSNNYGPFNSNFHSSLNSTSNFNYSYPFNQWNTNNKPNASQYSSSFTRFHGAMRSFGGFLEASAGAALVSTPFAPIGFAMLIHGADHFAAGSYAMVTGRYRATATEQLFQKTGMSSEWASFSDSTLSIGSFTGAMGLARYSAYQSSRAMSHAAMSSMEASASKTEMIFNKSPFHQAASQLSETGQSNIRILRGWAKSKGWKKLHNPEGRPEKWGTYINDKFEWNLKIKPIPNSREGINEGSKLPRFDARIGYKCYDFINPFTGEIGSRGIGSHIPLE